MTLHVALTKACQMHHEKLLNNLAKHLVNEKVAADEIIGETQRYCRGISIVATDEQLPIHKRDTIYIQFNRINPVISLNLESIELLLGEA